MKRSHLILLNFPLFFLLPLSLLAQEANSLLWKVTSPSNAKASYLFGTLHLLPEDRYFFTDKMQEAFASTETLALEMDIDIPMGEQMKMAMQMMMPDGKSWADYMTSEEFAALRSAYIDSLGVKEAKFDKQYVKIKPMYLSALILSQLLGKTKAYEQELSGMAKKAKKPLIGLETLQQQMDFMGSVSLEDQITQTKEAGASILREYNKMLEAYLKQDLAALQTLAKESDDFAGIEEELLTKRNAAWIPLVKEQAAKSPTFFAVGALHLVGEKGLISQLRTAGFKVEPVN
jgi:uncharacterized protein YbaP (TraB family)